MASPVEYEDQKDFFGPHGLTQAILAIQRPLLSRESHMTFYDKLLSTAIGENHVHRM